MNRRSFRYSFRYFSVMAVLGLAVLVILFRYGGLAAQKGQPGASGTQETERGGIVDRNGRILAMDAALYNIAVWKPETSPDGFRAEALRLGDLLGMSGADLVSRYEGGSSDFFYLKKRVQPQVARSIQDAKAGGAFSGVVVERVEGRLYPEKRLASHVLGFVGDGNRGLAGLENRYDMELSTAGQPQAPGESREPAKGNSLVLTIDSSIQYSLEEIARKTKDDTGAESVILLAGDAKTGEILAYVAMPDFDPNAYFESPTEAWYDWPSVYSYEPGSVFKVFSMASVMDSGGIDANTTFVCDGAYRRTAPSGEEIKIKCLGSHGVVNVEKILEYSCNAGAAYASDRIEPEAFYERLSSFGFGSRTALALPGESAGLLNAPSTWSLRSKPTIAMGQELLVTAVQMFDAATAVSNGGVLLKPILVRRVVDAEGKTVSENAPVATKRVISAQTAQTILDAMEKVSSAGGTGWRAKVKDVRMAVKTGTAQMIDRETKRYSDTDYIASTLAIFPVEEPRIIVYLAIVKPKGESYYGGRIAAPVVRDAVDAILSVTDLPRADSPSVEHPGRVVLPHLEGVTIGDTMPNLVGTPKRLLLPLLERRDIRVKMSGEGYVDSQSPPAGTPIAPGALIELELK